jgi:hypothetical protein
MNEWKYQMWRKKRGEHCAVPRLPMADNRPHSSLCGCGTRTPPPKNKKTRIVKRTMARQLQQEIEGLEE